MDHLPIPDHCRQDLPTIPYLGVAPKFDGKGFSGFPERHGLQSNRLLAGDFVLTGGYSPEWLESFLQEWLFFGTLFEFSKACKAPLPLDSFIRLGNTGARTITTRPLLSYTRIFVQELAVSKMSDIAKNTDLNHVREICLQNSLRWQTVVATGSIYTPDLQEAHVTQHTALRDSSLLEALQTAPRCVKLARSRELQAIGLPVALSIDLLCYSLGHFTQFYLGAINENFLVAPYDLELNDILRQKGWCSNRIENCLMNSVALSFVTSLPPSYDARLHELC